MNFIVKKVLYTKIGKKLTWLEAGTYPVVRMFDDTRVLLDVTNPELSTSNRQLTIVRLNTGTLLNATAKNTA